MENDKTRKAFDWKGMPEKAQQILGEDFWGEINKMIPKQGPPIDMYKTEDKVIVTIELPGLITPESIAIKIKGLKLSISGEIPWAYPITEKDMIHHERFAGGFKREITLPNDIVPDESVQAKYQAGLLEITIPRLASEEERQIPIEFRE